MNIPEPRRPDDALPHPYTAWLRRGDDKWAATIMAATPAEALHEALALGGYGDHVSRIDGPDGEPIWRKIEGWLS